MKIFKYIILVLSIIVLSFSCIEKEKSKIISLEKVRSLIKDCARSKAWERLINTDHRNLPWDRRLEIYDLKVLKIYSYHSNLPLEITLKLPLEIEAEFEGICLGKPAFYYGPDSIYDYIIPFEGTIYVKIHENKSEGIKTVSGIERFRSNVSGKELN
ncbi:MAG: hypothetical protein GY795_49980 [Desulfobacterales bacterium]|nr:hypothetical protein [Desulfobacterales bacterium]